MDAERWQEIKAVFDSAMELDPAKRADFIAEACYGDSALLTEVGKLITSFEKAGSFIEETAAAQVASLIIGSKGALTPGQKFGHYEIISQIGVGGMGEVYLAKDGNLERRVAIKILNEEFSRNESNVQRFIQEAKAASSLNHPNILVIHEIAVSEGANYIVSEYVDGMTLREVSRESNLKQSEILDIAIQISGALAAAHSANIVHRDIKPENVVIRPDGYLKILDFGLAKLLDSKPALAEVDAEKAKQDQTAQGLIMGTVNYMSPEQAKGEKVDQRTDIFSLGAVIYELVAGRTPFAGNSMSETFTNLISAEPQPLSRYSANVPDELERVVSKTLRKSKAERYQTIQDLQTDLRALRKDLEFDERLERSHPSSFVGSTGSTNRKTAQTSFVSTWKNRRERAIAAVASTLLLIAMVGVGFYFFGSQKNVSNADGKRSLAVLPFVNAGNDPNTEYLSDGITESVTNNLSQLSGLRIMSRNSAFRFKERQNDTKDIASQLGVDTLVTGDVKQLGDKFVINVHLIDASDDSQIWGHQYVKGSSDLITAQNEIAQAVAQNLQMKLTATDARLFGKGSTENPEAWQLYQRGRFHVFKLTPAEIGKGISYFQQAIDLNPNYARAYCGIADAYRSLALTAETLPSEVMPKSLAAARKAVELDDGLAAAHTALGATLLWNWNWIEAEKEFKRALELDGNNGDYHIFYAHLLSNTGRFEAALAEAKRARELDPIFPFVGALEGQFLYHAGRTDDSIDRLKKTIELAPNFWMPHLFASSAFAEKKMYAEAISEARKARELSPVQTMSIASEIYALAKSGKRHDARVTLNELLKLSAERFIPPYHVAVAYNGLGEKAKAYEWLEKGYEVRDPKMGFLKVDPRWNDFRDEDRFKDLMRQINFD